MENRPPNLAQSEPERPEGASDCPVDDTYAAIKPFLYNAVGGSTILWDAHFPGFRLSDFRTRTLDRVGDDWPISYEDLAPFYEENDRMMGVAGLNGDPGNPPRDARQMPPIPVGRAKLRVANASVMPTLIGGNTSAPCMMIAEKAADLILGRPALPAGP